MRLKTTVRFAITIMITLLVPAFLLAHGVTNADQEMLRTGGLGAYIWVGAKHMVTGYDHLLFLTGVIFFLSGIKDIVKFITAFTIGHSITLLGATYLGIQANEHLIDAVIALSVLYKGFENLGGFPKLLKMESPNLLAMVTIFGLIHGFGLSTRLQSFDIGQDQFLAKILCFNLGVELGQIAALIPIIFVINWWKNRKGYDTFYQIVNWGLVLAGVALFAFQMIMYAQGGHDHNHHDHHEIPHSHDDGTTDGHTHDHDHPHDHSHGSESTDGHTHDHNGQEHTHSHDHSHDHDDHDHDHSH